jgi:hypothetical protein
MMISYCFADHRPAPERSSQSIDFLLESEELLSLDLLMIFRDKRIPVDRDILHRRLLSGPVASSPSSAYLAWPSE